MFKAAASLEAPTKTPDEEGGQLTDTLAVDTRPDETVSQVCHAAAIVTCCASAVKGPSRFT